MRRQLRWYGASPLHLLAMLACFGLAGYAAVRLISFQPVAVAAWFLGAVIGHDLLLMPLYSLADRSVLAAFRHRAPELPAVAWINYVRVPGALSGLLLLVWFPLILRLPSPYHASTTLSADPYVWHWLAVTGALFLLSAVAFALRLRRGSRNVAPPVPPAAAAAGGRPDENAVQAEPFRPEPEVEPAFEPAPDAAPEPELAPEHKPAPALAPEPDPARAAEPERAQESGPGPDHGPPAGAAAAGQPGQQPDKPAPAPAKPVPPADSPG